MRKSTTGPVGLWVYCELLGDFSGPVNVADADGHVITVCGEQIGFVDYPLGGGKFESRLAVLGRITGTKGGLFQVQFRDGQRGGFRWLAPWQVEYGTAPKTAA